MRQLTFEEAGRYAWRDVPEPETTAPDQVLVRPLVVACCDLDVAVDEGELPMPPGHAMGHEGPAEVVAVGDAVREVRVGDRVIVPFQINCGSCRACRRGITGSCAALPLMAMYGIRNNRTGRTIQMAAHHIGTAEAAERFFDACESGKGWEACEPYCHPGATFTAQADALADIATLEAYTDWMKGLLVLLPDGIAEVRSFAVDEARHNVAVFGVFRGTHTGEAGPVPPTGKHAESDYVYVMDFDGDKIRHMTKIWNDGIALRQLGWA